MYHFPIFMAHFSMSNSIPIFYVFLLHVLEFPILCHFFANSLMSSMYIRWLIFSCDLLSFYPAVHFLSMWLCGIINITNSNGDSASP